MTKDGLIDSFCTALIFFVQNEEPAIILSFSISSITLRRHLTPLFGVHTVPLTCFSKRGDMAVFVEASLFSFPFSNSHPV